MTNYLLKTETSHNNLSPLLFKIAAGDYFKCSLDFKEPERFSVVPFFLCCRAIELALKAIHLERNSQIEIKKMYNHYLVKSYNALPPEKQILSKQELKLLKEADDIYSKKEFEYVVVDDPATAYSRFPSLELLRDLTKKIMSSAA